MHCQYVRSDNNYYLSVSYGVSFWSVTGDLHTVDTHPFSAHDAPATRRFIKYPDKQVPRTGVSRPNSSILAPPFPDTLPIGKYRIDVSSQLPLLTCLARSHLLSFCISLAQVENNNFQPFLSLPPFSHVRSLSTPPPLISPHRSFGNTPFFLQSGLFPLYFLYRLFNFLVSSTSTVYALSPLFSLK